MRRCLNIAFGVALLVLSADASARAGGLDPMCVPISLGCDRPVSSAECGIDKAASLTVFQKYRAALDAMGESSDSLRMGIVACDAEDYQRAVELLRCDVDNPFLEWFRGYYRALSLRKTGCYREAAVELDSILALADRLRMWKRSTGYTSARALEIEVAAEDDSLFGVMGIPFDVSSRSPREILALSNALAKRGLDSLAAVYLVSLSRNLPARTDRTALEGIYAKLPPRYPYMSTGDLRALAETALEREMGDEAEKIIKELLERDRGDPEALLLKGKLLADRGKRREAIALYDEIARSKAPENVKSAAVTASASLEYRLGNPERAVEKYRVLATTYRDWWSFDRAARIEVALGKYNEAIELWAQYVAGGSHGVAAWLTPEIAIRRASLLHWLGRDGEAHSFLEKARFPEKGGTPRDPGALYWLARTSPSDSQRVKWASLLAERQPASYYAFALAHDLDSLLSPSGPEASAARLQNMVAEERKLVDSLESVIRAGGGHPAHPCIEAWRYLIDRGLLAEAAECVVTLSKAYSIDTVQVLDMYLHARTRGFCNVAISIMSGAFAVPRCPEMRERLQHPVPFEALLEDRGTTAGLAPELILAVMYAESKFSVTAVSVDGASGVMQLMPSTARWAAQRHGLPKECAENLFDPACNIMIGSRYLAYLLRRSEDSLVGALAAYNAGEGKMGRWKEVFRPAGDEMTALELIGPPETANYVKAVLEALCYYRALGAGGGGRP
jgi:soluble lytic murein transglycosylase